MKLYTAMVKVVEEEFKIKNATITFSYEYSTISHNSDEKQVEITITGDDLRGKTFYRTYHGSEAAVFMEEIMEREVK